MADIGIIGVHRDQPIVLEDNIKICEQPTVIHSCPTYAIKPKGKNSVSIDPEKCIHCGACTMHCEAILTGNPSLTALLCPWGQGIQHRPGPDLGRSLSPISRIIRPGGMKRWRP